MQQEQFLNVIDRDEAERRFRAVLDLMPLPAEACALFQAWKRVLAEDIVAPLDVPGFDRSNVDGFAIQAADTYGASEEVPKLLELLPGSLDPGQVSECEIRPGQALTVATGAVLPRGADAVLMVEHTDAVGNQLVVRRPATPGSNLTFAGQDISRGETVLRRGDVLTARETGVLAALGFAIVNVVRQPQVGILSTGNELVTPGEPLSPGQIYDSNATVIGDAVRELGGVPIFHGIVPDDQSLVEAAVRKALATCDLLLLSGGTSKGPGDVSYRVVADLGPPGILAHGVALKPGKPLCLAAVARPQGDPRGPGPTPVVILPGFPTSAIFTFHEFVAPVIGAWAGRRARAAVHVRARVPVRLNSERGRTEYMLVNLVEEQGEGAEIGYAAYPLGKGSGSVTTFSKADGFLTIPRQQDFIEAGAIFSVILLDEGIRPADLVVMGSHCSGLDYLLGLVHARGYSTKVMLIGSMGGLEAARRGACDLAGIHLWHPDAQSYNRPYLDGTLDLEPGYGRLQGIVFRQGDQRFEGKTAEDAVAGALADPGCRLVNRNRGSGTRVLIDRLVGSARPPGFWAEVNSHTAVVAAVAQRRADWGLAIEPVAKSACLGFIPVTEEQYDFVIPKARRQRPALQAFLTVLRQPETKIELAKRGLRIGERPA